MAKIISHLWFEDRAEEAVRFYTGLIPGSSMGEKHIIPTDTPSGPVGSVYQIDFTLGDQAFMALNAGPLDPFNHSFSIMVECDDQAEIDRVWDALLEGGSPEQCGWLKDRYGVSWQVIPGGFNDMMTHPDKARVKRAADAMLQMVKFDIAKLRAAFDG
jgi:predicted 3-demethylubiquinone-9 3-methyltransferase (glyoxalase superfamily)